MTTTTENPHFATSPTSHGEVLVSPRSKEAFAFMQERFGPSVISVTVYADVVADAIYRWSSAIEDARA